jgi:hypothetical protein
MVSVTDKFYGLRNDGFAELTVYRLVKWSSIHTHNVFLIRQLSLYLNVDIVNSAGLLHVRSLFYLHLKARVLTQAEQCKK